jgi:hypothetical protein
MATSKHRKNHKKKLKARQDKLKQEKSKMQKMQREFIMNLIKQEQEKGLFNNTTNIEQAIGNGPIIEGPSVGPIIEGPSI